MWEILGANVLKSELIKSSRNAPWTTSTDGLCAVKCTEVALVSVTCQFKPIGSLHLSANIFPCPILLASSRSRLPVQTSEPTHGRTENEDPENEDPRPMKTKTYENKDHLRKRRPTKIVSKTKTPKTKTRRPKSYESEDLRKWTPSTKTKTPYENEVPLRKQRPLYFL